MQMQMKTQNSVSYLSQEAIESISDYFLTSYFRASDRCYFPPIPVDVILEKHLKLSLGFGDLHGMLDIPRKGNEPEVLGALWVDSGEVLIDEYLDPDIDPTREGRFRFTVAHEIGHWELHRAQLLSSSQQDEASNRSPTVVCRASQAKERIEWQADQFSSCLLMPRNLVLGAWKARFGDLEPLICSEAKFRVAPRNWETWSGPGYRQSSAYDRFADGFARPFASIFNTSIQAMRLRLEGLGLLQETRSAARSHTQGNPSGRLRDEGSRLFLRRMSSVKCTSHTAHTE
jgi:Zn-dependent peptidase ImmA (M78 family)